MSSLADAADVAFYLLKRHKYLEGMSRDQYWCQPIYHAMADAKYLSAISSLRRQGRINSNAFVADVLDVVTRLYKHATYRRGGAISWGLKFPYKNAPGDESYLITTALVAVGVFEAMLTEPALMDKSEIIALSHEISASLSDRSSERLMKTSLGLVHAPPFSASFDFHVWNTLAMWCAAVALARELNVIGTECYFRSTGIGEEILKRWVPDIGWPYSEVHPIFDLVHQGYIVHGLTFLFGSHALRNHALVLLTVFEENDGHCDTMTCLPLAEARIRHMKAASQRLRIIGGNGLIIGRGAARDWSVGELLAVAGRLGRDISSDRYFLFFCRRLLQSYTPQFQTIVERNEPLLRGEMHIAHGIALCLEALRANRGRKSAGA